jgi:hypothetical protein
VTAPDPFGKRGPGIVGWSSQPSRAVSSRSEAPGPGREFAQDRLRAAYAEPGKMARFDRLQAYLPGESSAKPYAVTGAELGISEAAVKMEVQRLRRRFGELLKEEIAHTVAGESEIEEEIRYLIEVVSM